MSLFIKLYLLFFISLAKCSVELEVKRPAFDQSFYDDFIDEQQCTEQLIYLVLNNNLLLEFLDAGIRIPRGLLQGNLVDMGNYYQCLNIEEEIEEMTIEGKYCSLSFQLEQNTTMRSIFPGYQRNEDDLLINHELFEKLQLFEKAGKTLKDLTQIGNLTRSSDGLLSNVALQLAVCIPKVCSTEQALGIFYGIGLDFEEQYCRLPNDKPWVPSDYIAIIFFSIILILTIISTGIDIFQELNPKNSRVFLAYCSFFSIYTNTRRLVTYVPARGSIECLDGIRSIAMLWVILGHTYTGLNGKMANPLAIYEWSQNISSMWIISATITVDTFFLLSGLLIVYVTTDKFTPRKLLKNIHLFYLNRLLRMFPVLATGILVHVSLLNWIADGPDWTLVAVNTEICRKYWWSTLLYIQNYVNPTTLCLSPTWYLSIDVQLHILSPIVLFWVLGKRKSAWIGLTASLLASLVSSTVYCFLQDLPSTTLAMNHEDPDAKIKYITNYYVNTLTRASPFFVGLFFGYILHLWKGKEVVIPKWVVTVLWLATVALASLILYMHHLSTQFDWNNQTLDNLFNSFARPSWAMCLGWMIVACQHGYAGPINWVLSLKMWKLPSRLSYALYVFHYSIIETLVSKSLAPVYFSNSRNIFLFFGNLAWSTIAAFLVTVLIDAPFSSIIKHAIGGKAGTMKTKS